MNLLWIAAIAAYVLLEKVAPAGHWTGRGTHKGELMGVPPTNKEVRVTGISIDRIAGGKIVEHWENFDQLSMMQQLGVIPSMG